MLARGHTAQQRSIEASQSPIPPSQPSLLLAHEQEALLNELTQRGYALLLLSPLEQAHLSSSLARVEDTLEQAHAQSLCPCTLPRPSPLPRSKRVGQCGGVELATFSERSQLRYWPGHNPPDMAEESCVDRAADTAAQLLHAKAEKALALLSREWGTPVEGIRVLDAFHYPGEEGWKRLGQSLPLPEPCPAHEDTGLVTLVVDNCDGLEVLSEGSWMPVELRSHHCALLPGRALASLTRGSIPACTHRVRPTKHKRTSLVYELRCDEASARRVSAKEAEFIQANTSACADRKFVNAVAALDALAVNGSHPSQAEEGWFVCSVQ